MDSRAASIPLRAGTLFAIRRRLRCALFGGRLMILSPTPRHKPLVQLLPDLHWARMFRLNYSLNEIDWPD